MISKDQRDILCSEVINSYLFENIWNDPFKEFRLNISPIPLQKSSVVGSISVIDGTLKLPTLTDRYYVCAIDANSIPVGKELATLTWISATDLCNKHRLMFHVHDDKGRMMYKGGTYVYLNKSRTYLFVAIDSKAYSKCCPSSKLEVATIAIYYDSNLKNDITMCSVDIRDNTKIANYTGTIVEFLKDATDAKWVTIFKNGEEVTNETNLPIIAFGDVFDVIIDRNIIAKFDIDLEPEEATEYPSALYRSTRDQMYKYIIHTPKKFNPNNIVYTHNTCDYYIRDKQTGVGNYVHRLATKGITQVTHNDISIPLYIVDAYRDYLGTQKVTVRVVVRDHDNNNRLVRDANYIDLLYSGKHDDETIVNILAGNGPATLPWWTADHLEQSKYVAMMFDTPNRVTVENMQEYVDALGFYHTAELLCHRVLDSIVTDATGHTFKFDLPVMYIGRKVFPLMYIDGKYLNHRNYHYEIDVNKVSVEIDENIILKRGTKVTVVFYMSGEDRAFSKVVVAGDNNVTIPYNDPVVYVETTKPKRGVMKTYEKGYMQLLPGTNQYIVTDNKDGTYKVVLSADYLNREVVIQNRQCTYVRTYNLDEYTTTGEPIALPLTTMTSDEVVVPILTYENMSVYLNGNYLVEGLDYSVYEVRDEKTKAVYGLELIIQTMDHFREDESDILDVIINIAEGVDTSIGFVQDDRATDATPVNLYFPSMTLLHVDGRLERDATEHSTYIQLPKGKYKYGAKFEVETAIPIIISEYIHENATENDAERLAAMNEYFTGYESVPPKSLILIQKKHRVYSTYMSAFITDVVDRRTSVAEESDPVRLHNYIAPYDYLKEVDVVFKGLDTRFIAYYPHYANFNVDANTKRMLTKYVKTFMPENRDPGLDDVY